MTKDLLDEVTYTKLCKLHNSMGHPHNRAFSRCLKDAGGKEEVWKAPLHFRCHACARYRRPELEPVAAVHEPLEVGTQLLTDSFTWEHPVRKT